MKMLCNLRPLLLLLGWAVFLLSGCSSSDDLPDAPDGGKLDRVVLVYMAGDNNLDEDLEDDIREMRDAMPDVNGRLVVYFDGRYQSPMLLSIGRTRTIDTVQIYPEENSASPAVLKRVIGDTRTLFPARSYAGVFSSHGQGWFPRTRAVLMTRTDPERQVIRTRFFGQDSDLGDDLEGVQYMDVRDLASAIPDGCFDFLMFDACLMSSVEVLYELREKAAYFIASPVEIMAEGFPYKDVLRHFWGEEEELREVCRLFYEYYEFYDSSHPGADARQMSAMVSLVKAAELQPLMQSVRQVLSGRWEEACKLDVSDIWCYPGINVETEKRYFDLREYLRKMGDGALLQAFEAQLEKCVLYRKSTRNYNAQPVPMEKFSGLSTYVPQKDRSLNDFYMKFQWPQSVYR